jgi:uncharacterized protein YuzE
MMRFGVSTTHDQDTGELLSAYFSIRKARIAETREFAGGAAFADFSKNGELIGVELLGPCRISVLNKIADTEPFTTRSFTRRFLRDSVPRGLLADK